MKKYFALVVCTFVLSIGYGQTKQLNSSNTVAFKIKNAGIQVDGKFSGPSGKIFFDKTALAQSYFDVAINANSINTGNNSRDGHLKKPEYFDAETHSQIRFKSSKIEPTKTGYLVTGTLTIKGISKEIKIPFTYKEEKTGGVFDGTFTLNRLDYHVGSSSWILSNDVVLILHITVSNQ